MSRSTNWTKQSISPSTTWSEQALSSIGSLWAEVFDVFSKYATFNMAWDDVTDKWKDI